MAEAPDVPTVDAAKAAELVLEQKAPYLDVRTQQEFAAGHAKGAINVPYMFSKPDGSMEVICEPDVAVRSAVILGIFR
jgi:rhodanese-related sulfurtransferase